MMISKTIKLIKIVLEPVFFKALLQYRVAANIEQSEVLADLSKFNINTVVDIGANRGQFALIARKYFPAATIYSFEPLPGPAAVFRRLFISDPNIVLYETALGDGEMTMNMHVSSSDDSFSLLPITTLQNELFPGTGEEGISETTVKPLTAFLDKKNIEGPALLKIDMQGFEKTVLEGSRLLLMDFSYIYVECSFVELYSGQALAHEVIALLAGEGFSLSGVYNLFYDKYGLAVQGDFLFVNNTSRAS